MPLIPFLKNELTPPKALQSSFKLKKSSKNATTLIFPMEAEMLLFSNVTLCGHTFENFVFERHHNFQKKSKIFKVSNQNILSCVRPGVRPM